MFIRERVEALPPMRIEIGGPHAHDMVRLFQVNIWSRTPTGRFVVAAKTVPEEDIMDGNAAEILGAAVGECYARVLDNMDRFFEFRCECGRPYRVGDHWGDWKLVEGDDGDIPHRNPDPHIRPRAEAGFLALEETGPRVVNVSQGDELYPNDPRNTGRTPNE